MKKLGIDAGALYTKVVVIDGSGRLIHSTMDAHQGEVTTSVRAAVAAASAHGPFDGVGIVGAQSAGIARRLGLTVEDPVACLIEAVADLKPAPRHVVDIGGSSLSMASLSEDGAFQGFDSNTLCAAGTGSFLDEQADRLGIAYDDLASLPTVASPPAVATRCAVFAKSDLIHRQQEGHGRPALWSGLCRGLAQTIVMTLFKGKRPLGPVVLVGGVALNPEVVTWISRELDEDVRVPADPAFAGAIGAARRAAVAVDAEAWSGLSGEDEVAGLSERRPPLTLHRSHYPSFAVEESYVDDAGNEVRIARWPADGQLRGALGIDIGSTSTKLALVDDDEEVVLDIYRKTGGDPVGATKLLMGALRDLTVRKGASLEILGAGTTGSGRKLVGAVTRADRVVNEITAHVTGAMWVDPSIDTIFEIGGQDAKYIHAKDGHLHNSNMNYVCAAGTGSFVEELARKLGYQLEEIGPAVEDVAPPLTSDRCTVFMEQDARHLLRAGFRRREVMGATLYSVVRNYLSKVVGDRHVSPQKVFFQGATARNRGLVAAFENLLDVEVVVSPYCHVMGSVGVALLTLREFRRSGETSRFAGVAFADQEILLRQEPCTLCNNRCSITHAAVDGVDGGTSWGYLCGRDADEDQVRVRDEYDLFRERNRLWNRPPDAVRSLPRDAPIIGMPRALLAWSYAPFWRAFFARLGYRLVLSGKTTRDLVDRANAWVGADYCFPVKVAHGHLRDLLDDPEVPRIFVPYMLAAPKSEKTSEAYFCPYNIGLPAILRSAASLGGADPARILSATLDLRWEEAHGSRRLHQDLGVALGRPREAFVEAWRTAQAAQAGFEKSVRDAGRRALERLRSEGRQAVVILGRPYNVFDAGSNLDLPQKIASLGLPVVPLEFLPLEGEYLGEEFRNTFWNFGRKIIEGARYIARSPDLYAIYFSNFSCGPDSFIQTYAESVMGEKPMLMLELDEHGADAGYMTRLEAFADVLRENRVRTVPSFTFRAPPSNKAAIADRTLWVPPMHEAATPFAAAAMRASGYNAQPLPVEDQEAFELGRAHSRGGECLPCPATLGTFLKVVRDQGGDPRRHALFMPTASGPCRFGQYCTLHRIEFDRMGWDDVPIVSWTSTNSYDGTDLKTRRYMWTALVLGDLLFKMRCRVRPYERDAGVTEATYVRWRERITRGIEAREDLTALVRQARNELLAIPRDDSPRPLVGIVGEIYVRQNAFTNQDVVRRIEDAGGEAWNAPISEWIVYTAHLEAWLLRERKGSLVDRISTHLKNRFFERDEAMWMRHASPLLDDRVEPPVSESLREGSAWFPMEFEGESILTVGRAIEFMKGGASLVVNCAPFGCMPGTMAAGVFQDIERSYGVPVANMFYDGEGDLNARIGTYLANLAVKTSARSVLKRA